MSKPSWQPPSPVNINDDNCNELTDYDNLKPASFVHAVLFGDEEHDFDSVVIYCQ
jgi:hypothetical protein